MEYKIPTFISKKKLPTEKTTKNIYTQKLLEISKSISHELNSIEFAQHMDKQDKLSHFRKEFHIPMKKKNTSEEMHYFTGNSLGLQPKEAQVLMDREMKKWREHGVQGHFINETPWFKIEEFLTEKLAKVIGAKTKEVAVMTTLTTNLHLLMVSFFKPTKQKYKILVEKNPFPSDVYAIISQLKFHQLDPEKSLIFIDKRENENFIRQEDIEEIIEKEKSSLALIFLSGVQFINGQAFEIEKITKLGHSHGITVGFDLAHAVGNLNLKLHDWGVDFACFCTYKYLNGGPGSIGGLFVHEKHDTSKLVKFEGWWGNKRETRFSLKTQFDDINGAGAFQLSNPSVFSMIPLLASLNVFAKTSMEELTEKSKYLTSYLEFLIIENLSEKMRIITPSDYRLRGCQISIMFHGKYDVSKITNELFERGVDVDKREPGVIRISPVPLYNTFKDVFEGVRILKKILEEK